jgi:hypothetical protein
MTTTEKRPSSEDGNPAASDSQDGKLAPAHSEDTPLGPGHRGRAWSADAAAAIHLLREKANYLGKREHAAICAAQQTDGKARRRWPLHGDTDAAATTRAAEIDAVLSSVKTILDAAYDAAVGKNPQYKRVFSWWSGACAEAAFRHIHNAEAVLVRLYSVEEVRAGVLEAARRAREALALDDPTRRAALALANAQLNHAGSTRIACSRELLSEIIQVGHDAADKQRAKLRTFRNVVLFGAIVAFALLGGLVLLGALWPDAVPVCFVPDPPPRPMRMWEAAFVVCPTRDGPGRPTGTRLGGPSGGDVAVVAMMGVLGGALSAAVFIRGLYLNNSTPYNVAIPLALSKLPAGGMTSVLGMILLAGDFVPGFTAVDKQGQVLAYAILFGFAQQLFTQLLDRRAERLLANVPTKARSEGRAERNDGSEFAYVEFTTDR